MSPLGRDPLLVACAVEGEDYVRHCAAMLHSLLVHHPPGSIRIEYLHGGDTSARGRGRLEAMARELGGEIGFHRIPDRWVDGLPVRGFTGKATWYRLLLPDLLVDRPRVLYLDCDLIVLDSLHALWETDLRGQLVGAVTNVMMPAETERISWLGLPGHDTYFNAGVLLMDLELMRREEIGRELLECARRDSSRLGWRDQDALNMVLHGRRLALHPRWNCMNAMVLYPWASDYFPGQELQEAVRAPAIRHFEGPAHSKPWHLLCDPALRRLYVEHRSRTPWPRVRSTGRTPANLIRYARAGARSRSTVKQRT